MKTFTYVIAPEGCQSYLTPGKKYIVIGDISYSSRNLGFFFHCASDINGNCYTTSKGVAHLNGNDWIIPEIGQWPDGWSNQQKFDCVVRANVEPNFDVIQDWLEQGRSMREKNLTAFGWTIPIYKAVKWIAGLFMIAFMVACTQPDIKPEKNIRAMVDREQTLNK